MDLKFKHSNNKIFSFKKLSNDNKGQLLLLTGISICISIVVLSTIAANLTGMDLSVTQSTSLKEEYDNLRSEFGIVLRDNLADKLNNEKNRVMTAKAYFENIRQVFTFYVQTYYDNTFNATLDTSSITERSLTVTLTLSNEKQLISEVVTYDI